MHDLYLRSFRSLIPRGRPEILQRIGLTVSNPALETLMAEFHVEFKAKVVYHASQKLLRTVVCPPELNLTMVRRQSLESNSLTHESRVQVLSSKPMLGQ